MDHLLTAKGSLIKRNRNICVKIRSPLLIASPSKASGERSSVESLAAKTIELGIMKGIAKNIFKQIVHIAAFKMILPITAISAAARISALTAPSSLTVPLVLPVPLPLTSIKGRMAELII